MYPGTWRQFPGTSGTVTLPVGASVLQIYVHSTAGGTVSIFGGTNTPVVAGTGFRLFFLPGIVQATAAANTIVFTGTDSFFVDCVGAGNT